MVLIPISITLSQAKKYIDSEFSQAAMVNPLSWLDVNHPLSEQKSQRYSSPN